jgi:hypothetical protein
MATERTRKSVLPPLLDRLPFPIVITRLVDRDHVARSRPCVSTSRMSSSRNLYRGDRDGGEVFISRSADEALLPILV